MLLIVDLLTHPDGSGVVTITDSRSGDELGRTTINRNLWRMTVGLPPGQYLSSLVDVPRVELLDFPRAC